MFPNDVAVLVCPIANKSVTVIDSRGERLKFDPSMTANTDLPSCCWIYAHLA